MSCSYLILPCPSSWKKLRLGHAAKIAETANGGEEWLCLMFSLGWLPTGLSVATFTVSMRNKANKYLPSTTPSPQKLTHKSECRNTAAVIPWMICPWSPSGSCMNSDTGSSDCICCSSQSETGSELFSNGLAILPSQWQPHLLHHRLGGKLERALGLAFLTKNTLITVELTRKWSCNQKVMSNL